MAKTNMINRDIKRRALASKYRARRDELRAKVRNLKVSDEQRHEAKGANRRVGPPSFRAEIAQRVERHQQRTRG